MRAEEVAAIRASWSELSGIYPAEVVDQRIVLALCDEVDRLWAWRVDHATANSDLRAENFQLRQQLAAIKRYCDGCGALSMGEAS